MRQSNLEKEEFWGFVLSEHAQSGLSISEFCRREGIPQASFYQWRKRLAVSTAMTASTQKPEIPTAITSFIPVEVVAPVSRHSVDEHPINQSNNAVALTIRTPQGYAIDVSSSTSIDVLQCSLRALQQLASETSS